MAFLLQSCHYEDKQLGINSCCFSIAAQLNPNALCSNGNLGTGYVSFLFVDESNNQTRVSIDMTKQKSEGTLVCLPANHTYKVFTADYTSCNNTEYALKISALNFPIWEESFKDINSRPDAFSNTPEAILTVGSQCKINWIKK